MEIDTDVGCHEGSAKRAAWGLLRHLIPSAGGTWPGGAAGPMPNAWTPADPEAVSRCGGSVR